MILENKKYIRYGTLILSSAAIIGMSVALASCLALPISTLLPSGKSGKSALFENILGYSAIILVCGIYLYIAYRYIKKMYHFTIRRPVNVYIHLAIIFISLYILMIISSSIRFIAGLSGWM